MSNQSTIGTRGSGVRWERKVTAGQTVTPGMLVKVQADGTVRAHNAAGQVAQNAFAVENDIKGDGIATVYAAASLCQYEVFRPGDCVLAHIANGENIAVGDFLESNGAGMLRKFVADSAGVVEYPLSIVAMAMEALNLSGSVNAGKIEVEVL